MSKLESHGDIEEEKKSEVKNVVITLEHIGLVVGVILILLISTQAIKLNNMVGEQQLEISALNKIADDSTEKWIQKGFAYNMLLVESNAIADGYMELQEDFKAFQLNQTEGNVTVSTMWVGIENDVGDLVEVLYMVGFESDMKIKTEMRYQPTISGELFSDEEMCRRFDYTEGVVVYFCSDTSYASIEKNDTKVL